MKSSFQMSISKEQLNVSEFLVFFFSNLKERNIV